LIGSASKVPSKVLASKTVDNNIIAVVNVLDRLNLKITTPTGLTYLDSNYPELKDMISAFDSHNPVNERLATFVEPKFIGDYNRGISYGPYRNVSLVVDRAFKEARVTLKQFGLLKKELKDGLDFQSLENETLELINKSFNHGLKEIDQEIDQSYLLDIKEAVNLGVHHETERSISFSTIVPIQDKLSGTSIRSYTTQTLFWYENILLTVVSTAPVADLDLKWTQDSCRRYVEDIIAVNSVVENVRISEPIGVGNLHAQEELNPNEELKEIVISEIPDELGGSAKTNDKNANYYISLMDFFQPYYTYIILGYTVFIPIVTLTIYYKKKRSLYANYKRNKNKLKDSISCYESRNLTERRTYNDLKWQISELNKEIELKRHKSENNITFLYNKINELKRLKEKDLISMDKFSDLVIQFSAEKLIDAAGVEEILKFIKDLENKGYLSDKHYLRISDSICGNHYKKELNDKYKFWKKF
jgi:hypothetical protein